MAIDDVIKHAGQFVEDSVVQHAGDGCEQSRDSAHSKFRQVQSLTPSLS